MAMSGCHLDRSILQLRHPRGGRRRGGAHPYGRLSRQEPRETSTFHFLEIAPYLKTFDKDGYQILSL